MATYENSVVVVNNPLEITCCNESASFGLPFLLTGNSAQEISVSVVETGTDSLPSLMRMNGDLLLVNATSGTEGTYSITVTFTSGGQTNSTEITVIVAEEPVIEVVVEANVTNTTVQNTTNVTNVEFVYEERPVIETIDETIVPLKFESLAIDVYGVLTLTFN